MSIPKYFFALRDDLQNEKQFLPTRAEPKASGWDVRAAFNDRKAITIKPFQHVRIPLGIRSFCPDGWWYELKPRSSTFAKKNLHALYGTIDETYENELLFACQYIPEIEIITYTQDGNYCEDGSPYIQSDIESESLIINFGDAIGQLIPKRRDEMEVVEASNEDYDALCKIRASVRGNGGFGSTDGKK